MDSFKNSFWNSSLSGCSVFGAIEPLTGKYRVDARDRRTKVDLTEFLSKVADDYAEAKKIVLVWDNLNTHKIG